MTIARNLFLQQRHRDQGRHDALREEADPRPGPEQQAAAVHRMAQLREALPRLPEADRAALLLRAQGELNYDEIACSLGITVSAAKVKVHRARLKLARLMDGAAGGHK